MSNYNPCLQCKVKYRLFGSRFCGQPCNALYVKERRKLRPEQKEKARQANRRRKYGLSPADYAAMLECQNGRCAICGTTRSSSVTPDMLVDHDHVTGQVRGLLCDRCNIAIGCMQDDPERLEAAAEYLRKHRTLRVA